MKLSEEQTKKFQAEKKALDSFVINNGQKVNSEITKNFINRGYLIKKDSGCELTEQGIQDYLRFYHKPDYIDKGICGFLGLC